MSDDVNDKQADDPGEPDEAFPCPVCEYDMRVQVARAEREGKSESRCPECGKVIKHNQLIRRAKKAYS
ncbi:MAG: hypothetical protein ABIG44_18745 [Planctomycetota bacterium]